VVTREAFGLRRAHYADIASSRDLHREALTLLRVIAGTDDGPRQDIGCLNAAPLLYVMDQTGDLPDGVEAARAAGIPKLERMLAEL
jgi:anthranilate phosphoribosyltransferase